MTKSLKKEYIDYRINSARDTLNAAKSLARDGYWNSVINRLYYVCFYAISALLYKNDLYARSHSGLKHQFTLHFIKNGLIDKKLARVYIELFDFRQEGDYADFKDFDKDKTMPLFEPVEELLEKIENLIKV
jgi:Uncharacterized conserved protein related to C-terminal domain of eukaryotic chaperone, SACSIN